MSWQLAPAYPRSHRHVRFARQRPRPPQLADVVSLAEYKQHTTVPFAQTSVVLLYVAVFAFYMFESVIFDVVFAETVALLVASVALEVPLTADPDEVEFTTDVLLSLVVPLLDIVVFSEPTFGWYVPVSLLASVAFNSLVPFTSVALDQPTSVPLFTIGTFDWPESV